MYEERLAAVRRSLESSKLDALLVTHPPHVRYLGCRTSGPWNPTLLAFLPAGPFQNVSSCSSICAGHRYFGLADYEPSRSPSYCHCGNTVSVHATSQPEEKCTYRCPPPQYCSACEGFTTMNVWSFGVWCLPIPFLLLVNLTITC